MKLHLGDLFESNKIKKNNGNECIIERRVLSHLFANILRPNIPVERCLGKETKKERSDGVFFDCVAPNKKKGTVKTQRSAAVLRKRKFFVTEKRQCLTFVNQKVRKSTDQTTRRKRRDGRATQNKKNTHR